MKIKQVTKYEFKGVEYSSLKDIKEKIHDIIGVEVIDKINRVCPPQKHADLFKLLDVLCMPEVRKVLTEVLNVEYEIFDMEDDFRDSVTTANVLDLK